MDVFESRNPATEEVVARYDLFDRSRVEEVLERAQQAQKAWARLPVAQRAGRLAALASVLRSRREEFARAITLEMGKPVAQAEAEVEKCALACDYFAENAERFLAPEPCPSAATESYVQFVPLGLVLAIMPWNFPFWQVVRFAVPAVVAGNGGLLKHAPNVPRCALACEEAFRAAGFPEGLFAALFVDVGEVPRLLEDPRVAAVTLTGSDRAGAAVAEAAGRTLKKSVLELGGSDPFLVFEDADLDEAARVGVRARFQNSGQSCIAAKRFFVVERVYEAFRERFVEGVRALRTGDPADRATDVGPLARSDLRERLDAQVERSVRAGAKVLVGGKRLPGKGFFYEPTVLEDVTPEMPAWCEEVFGPVAVLVRVKNEEEAVELANRTPYGLGASVWTRDTSRALALAREIEAGQVFVNGMVASDPRLPFGGIKRSGYGRELDVYGLREFVNVQTVWVGPARAT